MRSLLALALLLFAAHTGAAGDVAGEVVDIDANTRIKVDPKLKTVTGTDTAAAGSGAREAAREEEKKKNPASPERKDKDKKRRPPL
jgi:hypothetical protein